MPVKLSTTVVKIDLIENKENRQLIKNYHEFMKSTDASERHQNNNLKTMIYFNNYIGPDFNLSEILDNKLILSFLDTKKKTKEIDPDQKWISTWNHYFHRIKHFFRWYYNCESKIKKNIIKREEGVLLNTNLSYSKNKFMFVVLYPIILLLLHTYYVVFNSTLF